MKSDFIIKRFELQYNNKIRIDNQNTTDLKAVKPTSKSGYPLNLTSAQEPAWTAFVQGMKVPAKPLVQPFDRDALAKLNTPERMEKMNTVHEANLAAMQAHIKQRTEATRTFYNQLSPEQQKVFDAQTLPEPWKVKHH